MKKKKKNKKSKYEKQLFCDLENECDSGMKMVEIYIFPKSLKVNWKGSLVCK